MEFSHRTKLMRRPFWQRSMIGLMAATFALIALGVPNAYAGTDAVTWPPINITKIAEDFDNPVNLTSANDGSGRIFVVESGGVIHIIENGVRLADPFLDISSRVSGCRECGLLGLAFPPDFAEQGYFLVNYTSSTDVAPAETGDPNTTNDTVIARYRVTPGNRNRADSVNEEPVLLINQPADNHNGGHILFGPDNYLYIGMGDGGGANNEYENAQNPASLHGKILRIEVGATGTYTVPADNPFINTQGYRDEIWAEGLRNPWRFGFDAGTGDFYVADVGQGSFEEINRIASADLGNGGQNYGWPIREGTECHRPPSASDCEREDLVDPVAGYNHDLGDCSVTGGLMYESGIPNQAQIYLYADYCTGRVWGLQPDGAQWATRELAHLRFEVTSFGKDDAGNLYIVNQGGDIYRIGAFDTYQYLPGLRRAE